MVTTHSTDDPLTERQREIAALIADDLTNGEIAERLEISLATAKHHVSEILARLELPRREAVGDWYQARYRPGITRRLRGALGVPVALAAGAGVVGVVSVVLLAFALLAPNDDAELLVVIDDPPPRSHLIAYVIDDHVADDPDGHGLAELWVHDLDTGEDHQLIGEGDGIDSILFPAWIPGEQAIAFVWGERRELYRADLEGAITPIEISALEDELAFSWSPGADRVAVYAAAEGDRSSALWILDA